MQGFTDEKSWVLGLLIITFAFTSEAQIPDTLTLGRWNALAKQHALGMEEAQYDRREAELNYALYQADLKPQLTATANFPNYSRTSSETVQPDGTIRFQPIRNNNSSLGFLVTQNIPWTGGQLFVNSSLQRFDDFEQESRLYNGAPIRIGIDQPVFAFNSLKWEKRIQPLRVQEATKQFSVDRAAVELEATQLFLDLLRIQQEVDIARANVESSTSLLEVARERHQLGKLSDSDLLQLQVQLLSAERNEERALQNEGLAAADLYNYLGFSYGNELPYALLPEVTDTGQVDEDAALKAALKNRPNLLRYRRQRLEAERDIARVRGGGGVQASLFASFGLVRSAEDLENVYQDLQQEQLLQFQISVPILDWGGQRRQVERSQARADLTFKQLEREEQGFRIDVKQTVRTFNAIQEELRITRELESRAKERYRIARESYLLGAISLTDLTIAQQERDQARRTLVSSLSRYWEQYYRLRLLTLSDW